MKHYYNECKKSDNSMIVIILNDFYIHADQCWDDSSNTLASEFPDLPF